VFEAMRAPALSDTIAAIATPPGEGGIAIVRVSGPACFRIADAVFVGPAPLPSQRPGGTFVHGHVRDAAGVVDEVLLLIMRAPHSYTGEDTVEFQGHGGSAVVRRVLESVRQAGARLAEPGEFAQRAFLNGRMDLTQAEAVLDLIRARSDRAARTALAQLEGGLSRQINALYDRLLQVAADLEASLDFPEDELPAAVLADVTARLEALEAGLRSLVATAVEGRLLREGARVVIAGRPNAGKSTLLNALLGTDRAIVSHHPGTTRDTIEEQVLLDGVPVTLIDTAGLRDTTCEVEQAGILRTMNVLQQADAYLYVVDGTLPCPPEEAQRLAGLPVDRCLVIRNKADLGAGWTSPCHDLTVIPTALITGAGLAEVRKALRAVLIRETGRQESSQVFISQRHAHQIDQCSACVKKALDQIQVPSPTLDLAASALRDGLESLGRVTGRVYEQELLDSIFSRFCIGK
jgi:tRNA modification GTPase